MKSIIFSEYSTATECGQCPRFLSGAEAEKQEKQTGEKYVRKTSNKHKQKTNSRQWQNRGHSANDGTERTQPRVRRNVSGPQSHRQDAAPAWP
jgi:hypothetical protein